VAPVPPPRSGGVPTRGSHRTLATHRSPSQHALTWTSAEKNNEWNTAVFVEGTDLEVETDDYVHVVGTVRGSVEGENLMGEPSRRLG
jgi:hypothetical protein